jgi:hypothetical protein
LIRSAILVALAACSSQRQPADLAEYLRGEPTLAKLDRSAWQRTVVEAYAPLYDEYARAFDAAAPGLAAQLASHGAIATRRHYANDPTLTCDEVVIRWALPTLYPSEVATVDGKQLDAVFVRVDERWYPIVGMRDAIRSRVTECPELFDRCTPLKACREASWAVADAALHADRERGKRSCDLARTLCGPGR